MAAPWLDPLSICPECPDLFGMQQCVYCKLSLQAPGILASCWLQPRESIKTNWRAGRKETPGCLIPSGSEGHRVSNSDHLEVCNCWTAPPGSQLQQTTQSSGAGSISFPNLGCMKTSCYYFCLGMASGLSQHHCNQLPHRNPSWGLF